MPTNRLTEAAIRSLKPRDRPYKVADGGGLHLLIPPQGSKLWRLAYRFDGKQKTLAFGGYPNVTLAAARGLRDEARAELSHGRDPGAPCAPPVNLHETFERVATRWFDARKSKWTPGHAARVWSRVECDLNKSLGDRLLSDIQKADMLSALRAIESREGAPIETARRVKGYASDIFDFGKAEGIVDRNLVLELQGALSSPRPVRHRASVKPSELPAFLSNLRAYAGDRRTALALRLILHTFVRTSELRFATWDEFEGLDGEEPLWRIPAERMKMRRPHLVPLSRQAIGILAELRVQGANSLHLLPSDTRSGVISENTLIYALYRLGWATRATVHGFRGTASTVLNEAGFNRDWIERQLAHTERDDIRAAYNSAEWLADRRVMLQWWSDFLTAKEAEGLRLSGAQLRSIG